MYAGLEAVYRVILLAVFVIPTLLIAETVVGYKVLTYGPAEFGPESCARLFATTEVLHAIPGIKLLRLVC